jgi:hypothetical protein
MRNIDMDKLKVEMFKTEAPIINMEEIGWSALVLLSALSLFIISLSTIGLAIYFTIEWIVK